MFTRPCSPAAQAQRKAEEDHRKAELRRKLAITQLPEVSSSCGEKEGWGGGGGGGERRGGSFCKFTFVLISDGVLNT